MTSSISSSQPSTYFPEQLNNYWQKTQAKLISEFNLRGLDWQQLLNSVSDEQQADLKKVCSISAFVATNIALDGDYFFQQN